MHDSYSIKTINNCITIIVTTSKGDFTKEVASLMVYKEVFHQKSPKYHQIQRIINHPTNSNLTSTLIAVNQTSTN